MSRLAGGIASRVAATARIPMSPRHEDEEPASHAMPQFSLPRFTPAVKWLLIANLAVFALQFAVFLAVSLPTYGDVLGVLSLDADEWKSGFPLVPVWQLVTYGFLHDVGGAGHILPNLLILYFFGTMFESIIGTRRFLIHYFAAMLVGALFHLAVGFAGWTHAGAIGASGACMGIMLAVACLRPNQSVLVLFIPVLLKWLALAIVVIELMGAMLELKGHSDGTAHFVHLGGVVYGVLAVRLGWVYKDPVETFERKRAVRDMVRASDDEARMDQLLDKIHRQGMSSLSGSEKDFLKRMSSRR